MSIDGAANVGSAGQHAAPVSEMPAGMSYEGVMLTLKRRLADLGQQIGSVREEIDRRSAESREIAEGIQTLKSLKSEMGKEGEGTVYVADLTDEQREALEAGGMELPDQLPPSGEVAEARETLDQFGSEGPLPSDAHTAAAVETLEKAKAGQVSVEDIDNAISSLNTNLQEINSDNETLMIQMQEAISQRQVQIQLATNSIRAIAEGDKNVVRNIGA